MSFYLKKYLFIVFSLIFSFNLNAKEIVFESQVDKVCGFHNVDEKATVFQTEQGRAAKVEIINNDPEKPKAKIIAEFTSYLLNQRTEELFNSKNESLFEIEVTKEEFGGEVLYNREPLEKRTIDFLIDFENNSAVFFVKIFNKEGKQLTTGNHEITIDFSLICI